MAATQIRYVAGARIVLCKRCGWPWMVAPCRRPLSREDAWHLRLYMRLWDDNCCDEDCWNDGNDTEVF